MTTFTKFANLDSKMFRPARPRHAKHTATCTSFDYARAYAAAMISNSALTATPELNMLKLCRCWLTQHHDAGFAINSAGCIISMFHANPDDINIEMQLIDDCHEVGGWRFPS